MKRSWASVLTAAAIFILGIVGLEMFGEEKGSPQNASEQPGVDIPETDQLDDPSLGLHQVALQDLYFEIPNQKTDVVVDRKIKDGFTVVDILDKDTGEIMFTYGESEGDVPIKTVYRDLKTETADVRLQVTVEIDKESGMITKVMDKHVSVEPQPFQMDKDNIYSTPRSGTFPAENLGVVAHLNVDWGTERKNRMEQIYEGFLIGVRKSE
ncbi:hypothetical protein [Cytobacillus sp. NCCP-133]|uniref:hypothetical protein n=1 Tax=Cytobacillus sp. NCCP-133 TaxID=766848 RepID=UPI0022302ED9|nr:hypothetical protein [Cytobacillus sp. NCCP-133]GLB61021.1 hypothetical protein NCCP133_31520 [Cytobacillus sp. NCCP-133]